jgi:hypothetical protein
MDVFFATRPVAEAAHLELEHVEPTFTYFETNDCGRFSPATVPEDER